MVEDWPVFSIGFGQLWCGGGCSVERLVPIGRTLVLGQVH